MSLPDNSADIAALYQELILDHYRKPRNKGTLDNADATIEMRNPLCGDEVDLQVIYSGDSIGDVKFSGRGCSISQASASMMTQIIKGKSREDIDAVRTKFRDLVMGDMAVANDKSLGSLRALSGVSKFPARVKCALLAWNALESALENRK
ncbi:MAG: SUF system NifU family Fe-S cluster assembly protein [Gemmatimonadaceae bacterium]|nr:SUF system NifU family Fe-S cluster assembly protein [Gemmatimonadaceae bacterium]